MSDSPKELELKVELTPEQVQRIKKNEALKSLSPSRWQTRSLVSIYFDTPDHRLHARRTSLRVRRIGGRWVQTAKTGTGVDNGVSNPIESECEVREPVPDLSSIADKALRKEIIRTVEGARLAPVFETHVRRSTKRIEVAGDGEIELSLDAGTTRAERGSEAICEAELELKSGSVGSLLKVAEAVFANEPICLATTNKAGRGYRLATAMPSEQLQPLGAGPVVLRNSDTCAEAISTILKSSAHQILHNWRVVTETDDIEGPHQLRIGLRRLRSALQAFRPAFDGPGLQDIADAARDLALIVGELRDADVMAEELLGRLAKPRENHPGVAKLRDLAASDRSRKRASTRSELSSPRWVPLQLRLALIREVALAEGEPEALERSIAEFAPEALKKRWHSVAKQGKRLEQLSVEERHEMRKSLKSLRYAMEFFQSLTPRKRTREFLQHLKRLQDVFGYLNDVAMIERLRKQWSEQIAGDPEMQWAFGHLLGWHERHAESAWDDAQARWRALKTTQKPWS